MADPLDTNGDGVVDDTELLAGFNKPAEKEAFETNGVVEENGWSTYLIHSIKRHLLQRPFFALAL